MPAKMHRVVDPQHVYLRIASVERQSDKLTELEEPLYDYAKSEDLLP